MTMATMDGISLNELRGQMKAIAVVMGVDSVYAPGSRRADTVAFPTGAARIEEA